MHEKAGEPRILWPGRVFPRLKNGQHDCACGPDEPSLLVAPSASGLYDCDCGLVLEDCTAYDCDCGLVFEDCTAYDCDCGLVLDTCTTYDCDCGLVLDRPLGPASPSFPGPWVKQVLPSPLHLDGGWAAYFNPAGPVGVMALNGQARSVLAAFDSALWPWQAPGRLPEMPRHAVTAAVRDLARVGLLRPVMAESCPPPQPSTLSAWLHVTEACNLNCPYCYVHKRPRSMSTAVGLRAVDALLETALRHGYTALKLKYAGGEPALNFAVIQATHAYAARRAVEAGITLDGVLLSNGVGLTGGMLDFLAQSGMRLMVSLDGGPAEHDRVRVRRDGRGTHAAVIDTVERALRRGLRPNVSITLTALTLDGAEEAVAFALERGLPFNLNFYRECTGAEEVPSPLVPAPERLVERVLGIFDLIGLYPAYPLPLTGILDRTRVDIPHDRPCSAGRDYLAVGTAGQVSACQMLLAEPWSDLADADPLSAVRRRGECLFDALAGGPDCQDCPWRAACAGGCPLLRGTALHRQYCQAYRLLLPQLVRLEASRLIAAQSAPYSH